MNALPVNIFCAYAEEDDSLRMKLQKHLSLAERQGIVSMWHFRKLTGGDEWKGVIDRHLDESRVILLLISADFIHSDYCYDIEMKRAIALHNSRKARVIPVILRPCDWKTAPFSEFQALPTSGKPVEQWQNQDEAYLDIVQGIRQTCAQILAADKAPVSVSATHSTSDSTGRNIFCARCGVRPGERTACISVWEPHDFKQYDSEYVYCVNCGAAAGERTTCFAYRDGHMFKSFPGPTYCARCGIRGGTKSDCNVLWTPHDFKLL